jgi:phage repressor protein C with HTH and peptisase S24 domain
METVDKIFVAALKSRLTERGQQRKIAAAVGIDPAYMNQIINGKRYGSDATRRAIAAVFGFGEGKFEDFLQIGRDIIAGRDPDAAEADSPRFMTEDEMSKRGFFPVPFSDNMKLAAGGGGTIPITDDEKSSRVIIHGPSLGRHNAKKLQAFRVGGDSMEPLIAENGIVLADLSINSLTSIRPGRIYVLCWDLNDGECAVKKLKWAEKGRSLLIESANPYYGPEVKQVKDVRLIGKVIWAWREFKD